MYLRATSYPLSRLRFLAVCALLFIGTVEKGYGQRVYADVEQNSYTPLLAGVANPVRAIDADTLNYSNLSTLIGLLGAIGTSNQNLQFTEKPENQSPIMIKIMLNGSVLGVFDNINIERTNNGVLVGSPYTVSYLLDLLGLIGGSSEEYIVTLRVPGPSSANDGIRLRVATALGVGLSVRNYYAFYIVPPETPSTITACEGVPVDVVISNYQEAVEDQGYPYTYQLYTDPLIGDTIKTITFNAGILTLPADLSEGDYYLDARENGIYPSARTKITLIRNEAPSISLTTSTVNICQEDNMVNLPYASVTNAPLSYSIDWNPAAEGAGFVDITDVAHDFTAGGHIPVTTPPNAAEGSYQGVLTVKNANGCVSSGYTITVTVHPLPTITTSPIPEICEGDLTVMLGYTATENNPNQYRITWQETPPEFMNVDWTALPNTPIQLSIPASATMGEYQGILNVRNSETGCISEDVPFIVRVLPQPGKPHLTITDVYN